MHSSIGVHRCAGQGSLGSRADRGGSGSGCGHGGVGCDWSADSHALNVSSESIEKVGVVFRWNGKMGKQRQPDFLNFFFTSQLYQFENRVSFHSFTFYCHCDSTVLDSFREHHHE